MNVFAKTNNIKTQNCTKNIPMIYIQFSHEIAGGECTL